MDLWDLLSGASESLPREGPLVIGHEFNLTVNKSRFQPRSTGACDFWGISDRLFGIAAVTTMGALLHGDWKLIVGEQSYSDYRGVLFPCEPATPAPNCDPNCLFNCEQPC